MLIPLHHAVNNEGVAQVMDAPATSPFGRLQPCTLDIDANQFGASAPSVAASFVAKQRSLVALRHPGLGANNHVITKGLHRARRQW